MSWHSCQKSINQKCVYFWTLPLHLVSYITDKSQRLQTEEINPGNGNSPCEYSTTGQFCLPCLQVSGVFGGFAIDEHKWAWTLKDHQWPLLVQIKLPFFQCCPLPFDTIPLSLKVALFFSYLSGCFFSACFTNIFSSTHPHLKMCFSVGIHPQPSVCIEKLLVAIQNPFISFLLLAEPQIFSYSHCSKAK